MPPTEITSLLSRKDDSFRKQLFEAHYPVFSVIADRYSKNSTQSKEVLHAGFASAFRKLAQLKGVKTNQLAEVLRHAFIEGAVQFIRSIRNEYYVSSTVYAVEPARNYDLFNTTEIPDFNSVNTTAYIKGLQLLVPSQRLVFNLCVVDSYTHDEAAALLECSVETLKSNLEKARYNLQKNITTVLRNSPTQA
jgi:RNA polymerase sigma factor (sigma-70 family)